MHRHTIGAFVVAAVSTVAVTATCVLVGPPRADDGELSETERVAVVERVSGADAPDLTVDVTVPPVTVADASGAAEVPQPGELPVRQEIAYDGGSVLIQVAEGATGSEVTEALGSIEGLVAREVSDEEAAGGLVKVGLTAGTSVEEAVDVLAGSDGVIASAQPDFAYQLLDVEGVGEAPADAGQGLEALSTALSDVRAGSQWALSSVRAYEAWDLARSSTPATGGAVTVAVLDAGFDITHEDLAANVVAPYNSHTRLSSAAALSGLSHGTHVAGIVSAVANNAVGVAGVSYNARVMPIKVTDDKGLAYTSDLVRAYTYLMSNASAYNVRVVNLSMGGAGVAFRSDDAFLRKIDEANAAGIVTVAAAGNASSSAAVPYDCYPADYGTVVSVMNLTRSSSGVALSSTSNRNRAGESDKNIAAPGTSILSTLPGNRYGTLSGTSMAAPSVAGVLALEFAANPALTAGEAKDILYSSAKDLGGAGFDATYGYGEVDAAAAVAAARQKSDAAQEAQRRAAEEAARQAERESQQQIARVRALIAALPSAADVTLAHATQVSAARAAYNELSIAQHASIDITRLEAAERRVAELEEEQRQQAAAEAAAREAAEEEARRVAEEQAAREAAEAAEREAAERAAAEAEAAARRAAETQRRIEVVRGLIDALPPASNITLAHRDQVVAARHACDLLTEEESVAINVTRLVAAELRIAELEELERQQMPSVSYGARSQLLGWLFSARDGGAAGMAGRGLLSQLSAVRLSLDTQASFGTIQYSTYVQGIGWQRWSSNGAVSGTSSMLRGISALQVKLTGRLSESFDVCYRTYSRGTGWTSWMRNGATAGRPSVSSAYQLQAIQVKVVTRGAAV